MISETGVWRDSAPWCGIRRCIDTFRGSRVSCTSSRNGFAIESSPSKSLKRLVLSLQTQKFLLFMSAFHLEVLKFISRTTFSLVMVESDKFLGIYMARSLQICYSPCWVQSVARIKSTPSGHESTNQYWKQTKTVVIWLIITESWSQNCRPGSSRWARQQLQKHCSVMGFRG